MRLEYVNGVTFPEYSSSFFHHSRWEIPLRAVAMKTHLSQRLASATSNCQAMRRNPQLARVSCPGRTEATPARLVFPSLFPLISGPEVSWEHVSLCAVLVTKGPHIPRLVDLRLCWSLENHPGTGKTWITSCTLLLQGRSAGTRGSDAPPWRIWQTSTRVGRCVWAIHCDLGVISDRLCRGGRRKRAALLDLGWRRRQISMHWRVLRVFHSVRLG